MKIFHKNKNFKNQDEFYISWDNFFFDKEIKTLNDAQDCLEDYRHELNNLIACQRAEFINKEFKLNINTLEIMEVFQTIPCVSNFNAIRDELEKEYDGLLTELVIIALTKFSYLVSKKLFEIVEKKFPKNRMTQSPFLKMIEIMKRESISGIEEIINKSTLFLGIKKLDETNIQEIINLGFVPAYYWTRMLKEVVSLTYETFSYEREFGPNSETKDFGTIEIEDESQFYEQVEDFISKTQTLILDSATEEALTFFKLTRFSTKEDFKQAYRKLSKKYHPDLNKSPNSEQIMQKINLYKILLEEYFS
ncbi:DnaJ domain-containing protein [Spiroplasma endosymbiont of Crioceris asparagi]|uniref:DnaJ domain-containing protein n=1 Tax=Spiroplasma endosymbiont of Crioceris asparagi TaxID=3066286 RepID=UPI0030CB1D6A